MPSLGLVALVVLVLAEAFVSTVGIALILRVALRERRFPIVFGRIETLKGPFDALGLDTKVAIGITFIAISALKFVAAAWLWDARLDGAILQLALLGASTVFWYGFAVPYGPVLGVPQVILIALVWSDLS